MTRKIRLTTLALAIICFSIITPTALLYSLGYRYDIGDKIFIQTGAIYLKSVPSKAGILFDEEEKKRKTPLIIDGLLPGKYLVEVKLQGFHPWQKEIEVRPTLVTEAKNILLIPQNPQIAALEDKSEIEPKEILLSPDKKNLAFSFNTNGNLSGIWILNLNKIDEVILINNEALNLPARSIRESSSNEPPSSDFTLLQWSSDSNKLLFSSQDKASKKTYFIADIEILSKTILKPPGENGLSATSTPSISSGRDDKSINNFKNTGILNLTSIIGQTPFKFLWHEQNLNILLWLTDEIKKENTLFQLDLSNAKSNETGEIITKEIIDFTIYQNNIYIIKKISAESNADKDAEITPNRVLKDATPSASPKESDVTSDPTGQANQRIDQRSISIYKNNFELAKFPEELGAPKKLFILEDRALAIETEEEKIYLMIFENNNPLLINSSTLFLLAKNIKELKLSPDKNKILYWEDGKIKIYFLQKNISYEKEVGDIETINFDFPIEQVLWYKDSEHLIYTQNGKIRITEIDPRGQRYDVEFVEGKTPIYDPTKNVLYFLNKGNLYQVEFPTKTFF